MVRDRNYENETGEPVIDIDAEPELFITITEVNNDR